MGDRMEDDSMSPRTRKKQREKERRQILNSHYNTLLGLLKPRPNTRRMEKTTILEETITMMKALLDTNNVLQERNKEMEAQIHRLTGSSGSDSKHLESKAPGHPHPQGLRSAMPDQRGLSVSINAQRARPRDAQIGTDSPAEDLRQRLENVMVGAQMQIPKNNTTMFIN